MMLPQSLRSRPNARSMLGLDDPFLDGVTISEGFGVPAVAVESAEALAQGIGKGSPVQGAPLN